MNQGTWTRCLLVAAMVGSAMPAVAGRVWAQDTTHAAERGEMRGGRGRMGMGGMMLRGITLTADQQQKVDAIREKYRAQFQSQFRNGGGGPPDSAARAQRRTVMMQQAQEIRSVLTPQQQQQFDRNLAEMRQRRGERRGRDAAAP
jgi:Spy/CpxP family protein refolding chaperone